MTPDAVLQKAATALATLLLLAAAPCTADDNLSRQPRQATTNNQQMVVNNLLDNVLITVQREIGRAGLRTTELPAVQTNENNLRLELTDGLMQDLSSVYRTGTSLITYGNGNSTLTTAFSLSNLQIGYHVRARYFFVSYSADVAATVNRNRMSLSAGLYSGQDTCYMAVNDMQVEALTDVDWSVTGFGPINGLVSAAISRLVPTENIRRTLNQRLNQAVRQYRAQCTSFIPGLSQDYRPAC